eukprot:9471481-Pyramimonas_sp.AAC.1
MVPRVTNSNMPRHLALCPSRAPPGAVLGASWGLLGALLEASCRTSWGPKRAPGGLQDSSKSDEKQDAVVVV